MKLSKEKRDKISEQILGYLFHSFPKQLFTAEIAREIARDEEFIKTILYDLKDKNLIIAIKKNEKGINFIRRVRWQLTSEAFKIYQQKTAQL
jgi:predicted transcriptional regulator with HTH domain